MQIGDAVRELDLPHGLRLLAYAVEAVAHLLLFGETFVFAVSVEVATLTLEPATPTSLLDRSRSSTSRWTSHGKSSSMNSGIEPVPEPGRRR